MELISAPPLISAPAMLTEGSRLSFALSLCFSPSHGERKKEEKNHTRQELISHAANSRGRWSVFLPPE